MTKEDVIRMARASGWLSEYESSTGYCAELALKFAAMVAFAKRKACAKVCEENWHERGGQCANVIRARGQA